MSLLRQVVLALLLCATVAPACAGTRGRSRCQIDILRLEEWHVGAERVRVAYLVRGEAGAPGKTWLAARTAQGRYVSGPGREVSSGPFQHALLLELSGRVPEYLAVLEVDGRRCVDKIRSPRR